MELAPETIGPYRLLEPLGRGGMGVVWLAEHEQTGRHVALKTVRGSRQELLQSIRREIHALASLHHPGIVRILEHGLHEGLPWYAMELLEGRTLRQAWAGLAAAAAEAVSTWVSGELAGGWWTQSLATGTDTGSPAQRLAATGFVALAPELAAQVLSGPGAPGPQLRATLRPAADSGALPRALTLVRRLCEPLAYLHGEGLVHRDLKPDNVLLLADGRPVLVDFGLASLFSGDVSREAVEVATGAAGTIAYMAPEQSRGDLVDARADLYALGCILFEALTGRTPFTGSTPVQLLQKHLHVQPQAPSELCAGVPPALDELVLRLLAKDPRERLGHADDVAAALEALGADGGGWQDAPRPRPYLYRPGFAGREQPLQQLSGLVRELAEGRGAVALVAGESGVGKTRLLLELAREGQRLRLQVLSGGALPEAAPAPLGPLRRPLQHVADRCREHGAHEAERLLGPRGKLLGLYEPALALLPAVEAQPAPVELPPEAARLRLYAALAETFAALAAEAPLLLLLDDLHWADELTLGWLDALLRAADPPASLLVVGACRSEEAGAELQRLLAEPRVHGLRLGRLEETAVGSMVAHMLAVATAPPLFVRFLARHSEGNPFFVAEYLRTALTEGVLSRDAAGRWQVAGSAEDGAARAPYESLPLPQSIGELVLRRLEALTPEARALAEAGSVLGREMEPPLLDALAALDEAAVLGATRELLARQILEDPGAGRLRFLHDKIREVAYQQIPLERRSMLHRAAAEAMERRQEASSLDRMTTLGHHWDQAGERLRAARCWVRAGGLAAEASAVGEGLEILDRAVGILDVAGLEGRVELLRALDSRSQLRDQAGRFAEAAADARRMAVMAEEAGERVSLGRALRQCGVALFSLGDLDASLEHYRRAMSVLQGEPVPEEICETLHLIGWVHSSRAEYDAAEACFQDALQVVGLAPGSVARLNCRMQLGLTLYRQARLNDAQEVFQDLLARHEARRDELNRARCQAALGQIRRGLGDLAGAVQLLQDAQQVFQRLHAVQDELMCTSNLGLLLIDQGSFQSASSVYLGMRGTALRCGESYLACTASVQLAKCGLRLGRVAEAAEAAGNAAITFERLGDRSWLRESLVWEAYAHAEAGNALLADARFGRALYLARELQAPLELWHVCALWSCVWLQRQGGADSAHRLAREALEAATAAGRLTHAQVARLLLGQAGMLRANPCDQDQARDEWRTALSNLRQPEQDQELQRLLLVREAVQLTVLIGAEIALRQDRITDAAMLLNYYRGVADAEHELHELRARQIEGEAVNRSRTA